MISRFRERNHLTSFTHPPNTLSGTTNGATCTTYTQDGPALAFPYPVGEYECMTDVVIPRYAERSKRGEVFNNPMHRLKTTAEVTISSAAYNVPYSTATPASKKKCAYNYTQTASQYVTGLNTAGSPLSAPGATNVDLGQLERLAGTEAASNIDSPVFDGAVFVAELSETIGFLRAPLSTFNTYLEKTRKRKNTTRKGQVLTTAEFLGNTWLASRYAVRPLFHDMSNAVDAIQSCVHAHVPERRTARGYASASDSPVSSSTMTDLGLTWTVDVARSCRMSVRAGVLYEMTRSPDTFGVRMNRLPIAAWEALRFSFVIDWFLNIGPFIGAISPRGGITQLASWTTTKAEYEAKRTIRWTNGGTLNDPYGPTSRVITSDGQSVEKATSISVTRTPGIKVGITTTTSPFSGVTGAARIVDLAAIGRQILMSR